VLNSDASIYGGSGIGNMGQVEAEPFETSGRPFTVKLSLPPLSILFFKGKPAATNA
jgi:1,4-alpha-glucan branching enzyme